MQSLSLGGLPRLHAMVSSLRTVIVALTLGVFANAQETPPGAAGPEIEVVGVVGPRDVMLTAAHSRATKPVVVIVANRGARQVVIADARSLERLVSLEIKVLGAVSGRAPVLVPPAKFPITVRPERKLAVVFRVTFDGAGSSASVGGVRYAATVKPDGAAATATSAELAPATAARVRPRGPSAGATVTASPMRVVLKKGAAMSDPISFTAKWPGKSFFVSGWEDTPEDPVAHPIFLASQSASVKARWKNAGEYTVDVFLIHLVPGGGFEQADPSTTVQVIEVKLKDDMGHDADGMKLGISTGTNRSRMLTAEVNPASQTNNVMLKVTKGAGNLSIKNIQYGNGTITFQAEGIGKTGSAKPGDCRIEAQVDGKTAAMADVTVVVPRMLTQSKGTFYTANIQANSGTTPAQPGTPGPLLATEETFYGFPVTVTVHDQFDAPVAEPGNSHLYFDAPVFESFIVKNVTYKPAPINLKIRASSDYVDPVGFQVWPNSFFGASPPWGLFNPIFNPGTTPKFGIPNFPPHPPPAPTVFKVVVDGFEVQPAISRTLDIVGTTVTLTQTP